MMRMRAWLAAATLAFAILSSPAMAHDAGAAQFAATTLNLSATAQVRAPPDLAVVALGVRAEGQSAASAFAQARRQMSAISGVLSAQGVAPSDIQTSQLDLQAQYTDGDGKTPRRLTGYQASNTASVRLHDLGRVGAVVDALVAAGANQINGISFQLDDPTAMEDEARRKAAKALQAEAELYAEATGYHLQRLVSLTDGSAGYEEPQRPMFAKRAMAQSITPVAAGELTVSASLSATYQLTR